MEERDARAAIEATLYPGESLRALGAAKDLKEPTLQMAGGYNPWTWLGFTQSRFIQISFANRDVYSYLLPDVHRLELRSPMIGGRKLYVNTSGSPDSIGLEIFQVLKDFAATVKPLVEARRQAPPLPDESTTYRRVAVPVSDPGLAALAGAESIEFRCSRCGGGCGIDLPGSVFASPGGAQVYERCSGCLRKVEGSAHEAAR